MVYGKTRMDDSTSIVDIKRVIVEREIEKLRQAFHEKWLVKKDPSRVEAVKSAMEYVEHMIDNYSVLLGVEASGALKKRIVLELIGDDSKGFTRDLIDLIADVANGMHNLKPKAAPEKKKVKGGTVSAIKKRLGI